MINLIPPKGHASVAREYILRVVTVYGFIFAIVFLAGVALRIPAYVLVTAQLQNVTKEPAGADTHSEFAKAQEELKHTSVVITQLEKTPFEDSLTALITAIHTLAPTGVTFQTFMVNESAEKGMEVQVQGTAVSRDALQTFKEALIDSPEFDDVDLPISDLKRNTDLPFAMGISLEKKAPQ